MGVDKAEPDAVALLGDVNIVSMDNVSDDDDLVAALLETVAGASEVGVVLDASFDVFVDEPSAGFLLGSVGILFTDNSGVLIAADISLLVFGVDAAVRGAR